MPKVFGGLWFESLVAQDEHFELQCELLAEGLIQGIQMRVAHPRFTPGITTEMLLDILKRWPGELFIHFGAENVGVDFGQTLDEKDTLQRHGYAKTDWERWNEETIAWGRKVAWVAGVGGVVHPGYGFGVEDGQALANIVGALYKIKPLGVIAFVALENVPPAISKYQYEQVHGKTNWPYDWVWGFGGLPEGMKEIILALGPRFQCLIDFSHIWVTVNQARVFEISKLAAWGDLEKIVGAYLELSHVPVCHFSGLTSHLVDVHEPLVGSTPPACLRDALNTHEVVCLEIPFNAQTARQEIAWFRDRYLR